MKITTEATKLTRKINLCKIEWKVLVPSRLSIMASSHLLTSKQILA